MVWQRLLDDPGLAPLAAAAADARMERKSSGKTMYSHVLPMRSPGRGLDLPLLAFRF